jgi:uncharacterized membrane protein
VTIFLIWVHLLAAVAWIGGMLFLSLVVVPVLTRDPFAAERGILFRAIGRRFRLLVWTSVLVLLTTGPLLLSLRGESLLEPAGWSVVLRIKLLLVVVLIGLTAVHDFWLGPQGGRLMQSAPGSRTPAENL